MIMSLSGEGKPFALSPSSFPPHWTRGRRLFVKKKHTHPHTHFYSAKRVGRFPRWYGLPLRLLSLLRSHITHTYLTITPLVADSGALACWRASLLLTWNIQRTHFCPLAYYVTLHCITYLFLTVVWWWFWCRCRVWMEKMATSNDGVILSHHDHGWSR